MTTMDFSFGHKCLIGVVVRGRTHKIGGWGFERRWQRSACFWREKSRDS